MYKIRKGFEWITHQFHYSCESFHRQTLWTIGTLNEKNTSRGQNVTMLGELGIYTNVFIRIFFLQRFFRYAEFFSHHMRSSQLQSNVLIFFRLFVCFPPFVFKCTHKFNCLKCFKHISFKLNLFYILLATQYCTFIVDRFGKKKYSYKIYNILNRLSTSGEVFLIYSIPSLVLLLLKFNQMQNKN